MAEHGLTHTQRERIGRFIALCEERGVTAALNQEETKVQIQNKRGQVVASRPVSDFTDG